MAKDKSGAPPAKLRCMGCDRTFASTYAAKTHVCVEPKGGR